MCEVVYGSRDDDEESSRYNRGVALNGCVANPCVIVEYVDADKEGGLSLLGFVPWERVVNWMLRTGRGDPEEFAVPLA